MTNNLLSRGIILVAALALTACPSGKKCTNNAECSSGQICSVMSGTCTTGTAGGIGGGGGITGGGTGGGTTGGGNGGGNATGGGNGSTGGETCEMAQTIQPGTLMGDTTGKMPNYDPGCTGDVTPGPDVVYKISVPAGQRLSATATPEAATVGNQYDLALYLIEAPASNCSATPPDGGTICAAASDNTMALDAPETVSYLNSGTAAVDVFLVVDSYFDAMQNNPDGGIGAAQEGKFTLTTTVAPPPMGDTCATAIALTSGTALMNQDLGSYGPDYSGVGACFGSDTSNDVAYSITVPNGQLLSVTVTPSAMFDPTISVSESAANCDVTCTGGADNGANGGVENYSFKNTSGMSKTLFLVVDGYNGSTGTFSIVANLVTPPADDLCAQPVLLTPGTPLTAQTITNYSNDYTSTGTTNCGFTTGPDRAYAVTVPNGQRLTVTATPQTTGNPSLSLVDGAANCTMACVANATIAATGAPEVLVYTNRTGASKDYIVVADFSASSTGTFDIAATLDTPPADDVCDAPTALTAGAAAVAGTTVSYTNDYQNGTGTLGCASTGALGPDRVYQVSVPANQRATVTVTPTTDGGFNPSINFVEGAAANCAAMPRVCAAGSNSGGSNAPEVSRVLNSTGNTKTFFAIVDSSTAPGPFTIGYTVAAVPADDTCTTATALVAGTKPTETLVGFAPDYTAGTSCRSSSGPDRAYKVTLAANQKVGVTVTPNVADAGSVDPVINFVAGPAANCELNRTCQGGADNTFIGQPETAAFTNNTGASQDVFVIVGDYEAASTALTYSMVTTIGAAAAGESCGLPQTLAAGMTTGQTTAGLSSDLTFATAASATCSNTGPMPDRVYAITLAANQMLTVVATPDTTEDLILNLVDGAASTCTNLMSCGATADDGVDGDPETLTFTATAAKTVFLQVSAYSINAKFSLNVTIQ